MPSCRRSSSTGSSGRTIFRAKGTKQLSPAEEAHVHAEEGLVAQRKLSMPELPILCTMFGSSGTESGSYFQALPDCKSSLVSCIAGKYALRFLSFGLVVEEFKVTLKLVGEIGDNCLRLFWTTYGEIETKECSRSLVHDIKEFGLNKGVYTWSQTLREGNQPADLVTTYGLQLQEQLRVFEFVDLDF
ncbi:hypothetical protein JHK84_054024 [Glycine max]|nr:hypothetical protein JHK84_054024 [Glycine max]